MLGEVVIMMQYFFDTVETIPDGQGFALFGVTHLASLGLFVVLAAAACLWYRRQSAARRKNTLRLLAALLLLDELFKHACLLIGGNWMVDYLPLHLCSINIFLIAVYVFRPSHALANFLYAACLPGALAALLTPTWQTLPVGNFMYLHSTSVHYLLALFPLLLLTSGELRRDWRTIPKSLALLCALAVPIGILDAALGVNFMFLNWAPEGTPLVWFETHWGSHLLGFPVLLTAVLAVMYVPLPERKVRAVR